MKVKVKVLGNVNHDGAEHFPGDVIDIEKKDAERLFKLGVAEQVEEEDKSDKQKGKESATKEK